MYIPPPPSTEVLWKCALCIVHSVLALNCDVLCLFPLLRCIFQNLMSFHCATRFLLLYKFIAITNHPGWCHIADLPLVMQWHSFTFVSGTVVFYTGCSRKNSPIWEAIKFKTKEDTEMFFLFLERTQNAVLHQRVLNETSLKWRPWILIHWCSLSR